MKISWNKVTWYSKLLALAIFIAAPFYGFWLGFVFGSVHQYSSDLTANALRSQTPEPTTRIIVFSPGTVADLPHASGSCFSGSLAAAYRADAWRCSLGNDLRDPCFETADQGKLMCVSDPTGMTTRLALELTEKLPAQNPVSDPANASSDVWFVQLANHATCGRFTGTLPYSDKGEIAVFGCTDGRLIFKIDSSVQPWIAKTGTLNPSGKNFPPSVENATDLPIAIVWK